jgi:tetratricopeptide (TPR) repeat protein
VCLAQTFINDELASPIVPELERKQVAAKLGHAFIHYHHYCWALLHAARAAKAGGEKFEYGRAIDNLNYVILRVDPSFPLLPEVYFQKGKAFEQMGERNAAMVEYQNAVRTKTGYTPACAALARNYVELGDLERARAVLADGLKHDPRSKTLAEQKSALAALEKKKTP